MGPADMDEPGPGHGHAQGGEDPACARAPGQGAATARVGPEPRRRRALLPRTAHAAGPRPVFRQRAQRPAGRRGWPPRSGHHPGRKKKILAWTAGGVAVVVLLAVSGAYAVYRHLNGNLHQVNVSGELGTQPVDTAPAGREHHDHRLGHPQRRRAAATAQRLNTDQSDTLMIVHIAADRKWVDVMSIPRDSWVNIPACRMGNGQTSSPKTFKINEAFTLGNLDGNKTDLGMACMIKTVEQTPTSTSITSCRSTSTGSGTWSTRSAGCRSATPRRSTTPSPACTCRPGITCCTAGRRWPTSAPGTPSATAATWSGSAGSRPSCPRWSSG